MSVRLFVEHLLKMSSVLTRNTLKCLIFGDAKELNSNVPPTYEDVTRYYLHGNHQLRPEIKSKEPCVSSIHCTRRREEVCGSLRVFAHAPRAKRTARFHVRTVPVVSTFEMRCIISRIGM